MGVSLIAAAEGRLISGLGRIEPAGGVVRLSGPSALGSVLVELNVKEGDWVEKGQVIAMLDSYALRRADMARIEVELQKAQQQLKREQQLASTSATSQVKLEVAQLDVKSFQAALEAAKANLELALVRAPFRGQATHLLSQPMKLVGAVRQPVVLGRIGAETPVNRDRILTTRCWLLE